jgi:hypothetical protein
MWSHYLLDDKGRVVGGWWLCPGSFWSLRSFRLVNWGWCCVFYRSKIACTCGFWFATAWNWRWRRPSSSSARCSGWASSNKSRDVQRREGLSSFSRYVHTHHDGVSFWNFLWSFCDDTQSARVKGCSFTPDLFHSPRWYSEDPGSVDGGVDPLVSRYRGGLMIVFFALIV